jgi:hypothetical protein
MRNKNVSDVEQVISQPLLNLYHRQWFPLVSEEFFLHNLKTN